MRTLRNQKPNLELANHEPRLKKKQNPNFKKPKSHFFISSKLNRSPIMLVQHVTSTTTGGNWKEFWLAASQPGGGDIPLMQYHLDHGGVDPNYQHPEMESTALCEAVTAGNSEVVKFLLNYKSRKTGKLVVDPTIPAAYENQTPLEIAMELRQHEMADAILEALPRSTFDKEPQYCKTVLVTLPRTSSSSMLPQHQTDLITHILKLGHRVILAFTRPPNTTEGGDSDLMKQDFAKIKMQNSTGNVKFWSMTMAEVSPFLLKQHTSKIVPNAIDIWISFIAAAGGSENNKNLMDTTVQSYECLSQQAKSSKVSPPSQILLILPSTSMDDTTREQLSLLFQRCGSATKCNAMIVPLSSWWGNLTYNLWNQEWLDSIRRLLLANNENNGNLYIHKNLQTIPLLPTTTTTTIPNPGSVSARL
jgi:hypothetical protein